MRHEVNEFSNLRLVLDELPDYKVRFNVRNYLETLVKTYGRFFHLGIESYVYQEPTETPEKLFLLEILLVARNSTLIVYGQPEDPLPFDVKTGVTDYLYIHPNGFPEKSVSVFPNPVMDIVSSMESIMNRRSLDTTLDDHYVNCLVKIDTESFLKRFYF